MSICRICLDEDAEVFVLVFSKIDDILISEMIFTCSQIKVIRNDGLPKYICKQCAAEMLNCYKMVLKCIESDAHLRKILNISPIPSKQEERETVKTLPFFENDCCHDKNETEEAPKIIEEEVCDEDNPIEYIDIAQDIHHIDNDDKALEIKQEEIETETVDQDELYLREHPSNFCSNEENEPEYLEETLENCDDVLDQSEVQTITQQSGHERNICCSCLIKFANTVDLLKHSKAEHQKQRIHSNIKAFECQICFKRFSSKTRLQLHEKGSYIERNFVCRFSQCGARFQSEAHVKRHQKNTHLPKERQFECEICQKMFLTKPNLTAHLKCHRDDKKFFCVTCFKKFLRKADLETHMVSHTDERPFACELCSTRFKTKAHSRLHQKVHTKEKPHKCDRCDMSFGTYSARKIHQLAHDGIFPYKCEDCGKNYQRNTKLQLHIRRHHTGVRPFPCDQCTLKFYQNWELTAHKKKKHSQSNEAATSDGDTFYEPIIVVEYVSTEPE